MALKQKTVTIGGDDFLITTLPATKGIKILKQLTKLAGPAFGELTKGEAVDGANVIGNAIAKLVENLDQVEIEVLVKELVSSATKGTVAINFDSEFSGEYAKLFMLVKEIVEFNYGSVFTLLGTEE